MKFYLDEHLSPTIATIAVGLGLDVVSAVDLGRLRVADELHLQMAGEEGRCVVTADRRDFIQHTYQFQEDRRPHAGVLLLPSSLPPNHYTGIARALLAYVESHPDGILPYTVDYLRAP